MAPRGTGAPARRGPRPTPPPAAQALHWHQPGAAVLAHPPHANPTTCYPPLQEQCAAILFLASGEAAYLTGVTLPVASGDLG